MSTHALFVILLVLAVSQASVTPRIPLEVSDVALSQMFYLGQITVINATLTNVGAATVTVLGVVAEFSWRPHNSSAAEPRQIALAPQAQYHISISILVPPDTFTISMKYRFGVNTSEGMWYDIWRDNRVYDYWAEAYVALGKSIERRLTNAHYTCPEPNQYATEAVALLNDAQNHYLSTEQGYNLLSEADRLVDKADAAQQVCTQSRRDMSDAVTVGMVMFFAVAAVAAYFIVRHRKRRLRPHSRTRA